LTDLEKQQLERQRQLVHLRQQIAYEAARIGTMINYSVCLFSPENMEAAEGIKKRYEAEYAKIKSESNIYILRFHPESTLILKKRALKSLTDRLNKLLDTMDKMQEKINKKEKKRVTEKELENMEKTLETINDLTQKFKIDDEMSDILKIATERIKGVSAD
jgi:hypothetical protein